MKKILFGVFAGIILATVISINGCKKDDTTAPVISAGSDMTISLNSSTVSEPAYSANDEEDGSVSVTSDWSWGTNPNPNATGSYTIHYSATDAAGNQAAATLTVTVRNDAYALAGNYLVTDTCGTTQVFNYAQTITVSSTVNNRIKFDRFADYSNNSGIYADITGTSITLPSQVTNDIGSLLEDHTFSGTGLFITSPNIILHLNYTDQNVSASSTASCSAWFVKQ